MNRDKLSHPTEEKRISFPLDVGDHVIMKNIEDEIIFSGTVTRHAPVTGKLVFDTEGSVGHGKFRQLIQGAEIVSIKKDTNNE